jgi:hypothetical protein
MLRLIKAGIVGGIVLFMWYTISWTVMTWHQKTFHSLPFGDVILQTMLEANQNLQEDALKQRIYIAPIIKDMKDKQSQGYDESAFAFIALSPNGLKSMNSQILFSIITQTLLAFLMSLLIIMVNTSNFFKAYSIILVNSFIYTIGYALPSNNWWGFAPDYIIVDSIDVLIAWALAGIPIAFFAKTKNS